jgi:hypothetical protein
MKHKPKNALADELAWYEANKNEWLDSHQEKFVLISNQTVAGFYDSYAVALERGLQTFGVSAEFLIKQVVEHEPVFVIY